MKSKQNSKTTTAIHRVSDIATKHLYVEEGPTAVNKAAILQP